MSDEQRKQYEKPAEELLRYLLFANEAPLESPVKGDSGIRAGIRRARPARFPRAFAARLRSAHAHLQISLQLSDLFEGIRRHTRTGQGLRLSSAVGSFDRSRTEPRFREADWGGSTSDPGNSSGDEARTARRVEKVQERNHLMKSLSKNILGLTAAIVGFGAIAAWADSATSSRRALGRQSYRKRRGHPVPSRYLGRRRNAQGHALQRRRQRVHHQSVVSRTARWC